MTSRSTFQAAALRSLLVALPLSTLGPAAHAGGSTPRPPAPSPDSVPQQVTDLPPLQLPHPELGWRESSDARARRTALIVAADQARDSRVALPQARRAAEALAGVLGEMKYETRILAGSQVDALWIEKTLDELTADMRAAGNHLLVAWIGHGYTEGGSQGFATAASSWVDGEGGAPGRLAKPMPYDTLLSLVSEREERVRAAGGELSTVMWIDACRVGTQHIGAGRFTWDEEDAHVQLFSAGPGKEAFLDETGVPRFTTALCSILAGTYHPDGGRAGLRPVDLRQAFDRATAESELLRRQAPEWIGRKALDRFLLYDPAYLGLTIRAIDAGTGEPIAGALLTLQDRKKNGPVARFDGLTPSAEGYWLDVRAPGYFNRTTSVELERVEAGLALDVPLVPAFVAVEGVVHLTGGAGQTVVVDLEGGGARVEPSILTGSGAYRLLAAPATDACRLVVRHGDREVFGEELRLAALASPRVIDDVEVPVFVRDPLRLDLSGSARVGAGAIERAVGPIELSFDFDSLARDDFLTGWRTYEGVRKYAERSEFERALRQLERLGGKENLVDAAQARFEALRAELALSTALEEAEALRERARAERGAGRDREARELMDQAIQRVAEHASADDARVRELLTSWLLVSVENWHALREYGPAFERLAQLARFDYDEASLDAQRARIANDWLNELFQGALATGDWPRVRANLERLRLSGVPPEVEAEWLERIDRESISPTCRAAFERGKAHQASGERFEARAAYAEALADPGLNQHYRERMLPLVQYVEDELYRRHEQIAFEKERDDPRGALLAYLAVAEIEPSLDVRIGLLLEDHPELASLDEVSDYQSFAPWRTCVEAARRDLARGEPMMAYERLVATRDSNRHRTVDARLLSARIAARATPDERARIAASEAQWAADRERCERALADVLQALEQDDPELASELLDEAAKLPRVDRREVTVLRILIMQAESERERRTGEAQEAIDAVAALTESGRLDEAQSALERLPLAIGSLIPESELQKLVSLLSREIEDQRLVQTLDLTWLRDRARYATLNEAQVRRLAELARDHWRDEFVGFELVGVEPHSCGGRSHWISTWRHEMTLLEFALLPGGGFWMGSPPSDSRRDQDEKLHWITLDPFLIAKTECTQDAWKRLAARTAMNEDPSHYEGSAKLPVESISRDDASSWCGLVFMTLPTEAQWEYACRAGTTTAWSPGNDPSSLARFGNCASADGGDFWTSAESWRDGYAEVAPVGSFEPNAFGLYDMHGNVWEWCRDTYMPYDTPVVDGTGLRHGSNPRDVYRGGSYTDLAETLRSAKRGKASPNATGRNIGFRPSVDLPF